jgi:uncharacterized protein involved in exopolysaccharide biosynthesis
MESKADSSRLENQDRVDLRNYLQILLTSWWLIGGCAIVGLMVGGLVVLLSPIAYRSTINIRFVPSKTPGVTPITPTLAKALLTDPQVIHEVSSELPLAQSNITTSMLQRGVDVQPMPLGNGLTLAVTLPNPNLAAKAALLITERGIAKGIELDRSEAVATRQQLSAELDRITSQLEESQRRLADFRSTAGLTAMKEQAESRLEDRRSLQDLDVDILAERARLESLELEAAKRSAASPAKSTPFEGTTVRGQSSASPQKTGEAPGETTASLADQIAASKASLAMLQSRQRALSGRLGTKADKPAFDRLERAQIEAIRLEDEYKGAFVLYSDLSNQLRKIDARLSSTVSQLDREGEPQVPSEPMPRRAIQFMMLGLLAGGLFGVSGALLRSALRGEIGSRQA